MRKLITAAFGSVFIGSGVFDQQWIRHLYASRGGAPDMKAGAIVYLKYKADVIYVTRTEYNVHMINVFIFYITIGVSMAVVVWANRAAFKRRQL